MLSPTKKNIVVQEARSKELVPVLDGVALHSLHNPQREAEVFASNHLAHLSRSPYALVLGLGFGYHIEEVAKVLRLRHKESHIAVVEPVAELVRLYDAYAPGRTAQHQIYTAPDVDDLFRNDDFCRFLLRKPVVLIHHPSFQSNTGYFRSFLERRASPHAADWKLASPELEAQLQHNPLAELPALLGLPGDGGHLLRAYWELKHAE